jgi:8-oxo-dGTP pyrophosphatase MutT (NUDIX family)
VPPRRSRSPAPVAVVDVGGGSTEIVVGDDLGRSAIACRCSSARTADRAVPGRRPADRRAQIAAARAEIDARLDEADAGLAARSAPLGQATLVAVAGTATTLAALALGLEVYDRDAIHGARLDRDTLAALTDKLLATDAAGRARLGPVQPGVRTCSTPARWSSTRSSCAASTRWSSARPTASTGWWPRSTVTAPGPRDLLAAAAPALARCPARSASRRRRRASGRCWSCSRTPRGPRVVLTRRRRDLRSHPGQVSFPGGRIDPGEGHVDAAVREAREEVGLDPDSVEVRRRRSPVLHPAVAVLGRPRRRPVDVHPHTLAENPWEVDEILRVPLASC